MNELNIILKQYPNVNRDSLLILVSNVLDGNDNNSFQSLKLLEEFIDNWCNATFPFYIHNNPILKEISKSESFYNLLNKVENYMYDKDRIHVEGLRIKETHVVLWECSQDIPEYGPYGGSGPFYEQ